MALGFLVLAWRFPVERYGFSLLIILTIFAMFLIMSMIDIDTYTIPDSLSLPALLISLLASFLLAANLLPNFSDALFGASLAAGVIALINRVGSLVLRRFKDTKERLWPIGMDQLNIAALGGALLSWQLGLGLALLSLVLNFITRKTLRLSEPVLYLLWFISLALIVYNPFTTPFKALSGTFVAAGAVAMLGALFWWFYDIFSKNQLPELEEDLDEPIAMGFGDVKLAAIMGALLGWQNFLFAFVVAVCLGAIGGIIGKFLSGNRQVPFGPYLAVATFVALFVAQPAITWYLGQLGF
ncbi:MAG: A24 family peptidase [Deinococcales bacterium]